MYRRINLFLETHQQTIHLVGFFLFVIACIIAYNYEAISDYGPVSTHRWRQADSATQALSYFENGLNFFWHEVHHVVSGNHKAVSEFPILYYITAIGYKWFGVNDNYLRLLNYALFIAGIFAFSKIVLRLTHRPLLTLGVVFLFLSSPLLAFYSFNYIPNTPALGIGLLAGGFYYGYLQNKKLRRLYLAGGCMALAAMIKPPLLIIPFALLLTRIIAALFYEKDRTEILKLIPSTLHFTIATLLVIGLSIGWILYAKNYNETHQSWLFLLGIKPFWTMALSDIKWTLGHLWESFWPRLWMKEVTYAWIFIFLFTVVYLRRLPIFLRWFYVLTTLGFGLNFLLFFEQLQIHDYYLIDITPVFFLMMGIFLFQIKKWLSQPAVLTISIIGFFLLSNMNFITAKKYMDEVLRPDFVEMQGLSPAFYDTGALRAYTRSLGLDYHGDLVVSLPDASPNLTLYYLNLRGSNLRREDIQAPNLDGFIKNGYKYLIVSDKKLLKNEILKPYLQKPIGNFKDEIFFFKL